MAQWIAYTHQNQHGFGKLAGEDIQVHTGNLFSKPTAQWHGVETV
jgi:hypothetical protein